MSTYSILVTNNAPGCATEIEQQLTVTECTSYIIRLASNSNALGPFNILVNNVIYYSNISRNDMLNGVVVDLQCATPTPTPTNTSTPTQTPTQGLTPTPTPTNTTTPTNTLTPTQTPTQGLTPTPTPTNTSTPTQTSTQGLTPTPTPTNTTTPTPTPTQNEASINAYLFPEPQDSTSLTNLGQFMFDSGAVSFFGWGNSGTPAGINYASDLAKYVQFPGWSGSSGNFITNVSTLSGAIRQSSGTGVDSYGCPQNQYAFGSIQVSTSQVNTAIQYTYTVWIPLNGVGGSLTNMTVDVGFSNACSNTVINNGIPDITNAGINITVPSGCVIPSGTYRVLWMNELSSQPSGVPLTTTLWVKGDSKS